MDYFKKVCQLFALSLRELHEYNQGGGVGCSHNANYVNSLFEGGNNSKQNQQLLQLSPQHNYFQYTSFGSCELMFLCTRFHKPEIEVARAAILD